jgi:hypothetical protein
MKVGDFVQHPDAAHRIGMVVGAHRHVLNLGTQIRVLWGDIPFPIWEPTIYLEEAREIQRFNNLCETQGKAK